MSRWGDVAMETLIAQMALPRTQLTDVTVDLQVVPRSKSIRVAEISLGDQP